MLTRRQQAIHEFLLTHADEFRQPPTLDELCRRLGLTSRGSLHKHIQALISAGLVEPMDGRQRGIRLVRAEPDPDAHGLPMLGYIAAGKPIEAVPQPVYLPVPPELLTGGHCYVLKVRGDSMIEEGILDGDWVVIEQRDHARNGEIVVALVRDDEATLKRIEQTPGQVILHAANRALAPMRYRPDEVRIQGVLVGLMRRYR
ncbi:MAG: transcriptional repressor LexA [Thiotrichales bacterium]